MALTAMSAVPQVVYELTATPAVVSALTVADQTFTVPGLRPSMNVVVNFAALDTNLVFSHAWVSAVNTLKVRLMNPTVADITPVSQAIKVTAV